MLCTLSPELVAKRCILPCTLRCLLLGRSQLRSRGEPTTRDMTCARLDVLTAASLADSHRCTSDSSVLLSKTSLLTAEQSLRQESVIASGTGGARPALCCRQRLLAECMCSPCAT